MRLEELLSGGPAKVDWERVRADAPGLHALAMDIWANGLREPIVTDEYGRICDGIHRSIALWLLGWDKPIATVAVVANDSHGASGLWPVAGDINSIAGGLE